MDVKTKIVLFLVTIAFMASTFYNARKLDERWQKDLLGVIMSALFLSSAFVIGEVDSELPMWLAVFCGFFVCGSARVAHVISEKEKQERALEELSEKLERDELENIAKEMRKNPGYGSSDED